MPDHLYLPTPGQPVSWRDHLRAHPLSVTLLALVTIGALGIIADSLLLHALLPSLEPIPRWVQGTLGGLLLLGAVTALVGMMWRPRLMPQRDGRIPDLDDGSSTASELTARTLPGARVVTR